MRRIRWTVGAFCAAALLGGSAWGANVKLQYNFTDSAGTGFNDPSTGSMAQQALMAAGQAWVSRLTASFANETIVVNAHYADEGGTATGATLASAGPNGLLGRGSVNPAYSGTVFYALPLYNHLNKSDANGTAEEIDVTVNSSIGSAGVLGGTQFYYGTDGNPGNKIDFESVVAHEIGHGLGILSITSSDGSYTGQAIPSIYDTYLKSSGTMLTSMTQSARATALVTSGLTFVGSKAVAGNGGTAVPIYAPNPYEDGSSTSHVDQSIYDLMNAVYPGVNHTPSEIDFGILADEGWDVIAAPEPTSLCLLALVAVPTLGRRRRRRMAA